MLHKIKPLIKSHYLIIFFIISIFSLEIIFRALTNINIFTTGTFISFIFIIVISTLFFLICSIFTKKISYILAIILLVFTGLIYSTQFIYFKFFRTFYSIYSATNSTAVFEFWGDISTLLLQNLHWFLLFFLPATLIGFIGNKYIPFQRLPLKNVGIIAGSIIVFHLVGLATIHASGEDKNTAYDLYYKSNNPILSADRLGIFTTMRIDLQRLATGWSPKLEVANPYLPAMKPVQGEPVGEPNDLEPKEEKIIEYNTMEIDFASLIENEKNKSIREMHEYFSSVPPTTKNEYTGKFAGYNLVFLTAEGFSPYAVHEEVTPTLYKLVHEGYHFPNFYNPIWGVSTTDGEYVATTGLIPKAGTWSFRESHRNYLPFVMGNQLNKLGYKSMAYHNHSYDYYRRDLSHPNMGYDYKGIGNGLKVRRVWPASDLEMMEVSVDEYIHEEPFHAYYMTMSGHMQYNFFGNNMAAKNKEHVDHLPLSTQAKAYIATHVELDRAMEFLLNSLEEAGVADNTLIVMSADHYPYGLEFETINEFLGHKVEKNFELFRSPLIIFAKGMQPMTIDKPVSSLDIIPTISNLLGLEYDSRLLMGRDILSDSDPLVIFKNRSWITDKGRYNGDTGKFTPNEGIDVNEDYVEWMNAIVESKFFYSQRILETDYYRKVLGDLED
ncbi:hypothetical protein CIB95_10565 [Lottiidibacillus patelloidae]|uniref:Sulfatase N-terminal domain-containing protein n=1 Tax=Lottiidibacillus patelloidae TaxID=2670334 RepID=A0A263BSI8_9BACI|nr:alkaline phosphatase family protein [Lottiidibacillus patelloidae]OZM56659.1 hypothetical protein CIB95_10565 [Lottiidibacillus patelloidae]